MHTHHIILDSIVVSIPACHAGDRGSIPRRGEKFLFLFKANNYMQVEFPLKTPKNFFYLHADTSRVHIHRLLDL
jgi:hypothetical protein